MRLKNRTELRARLREAERELDAAKGRTAVNAAAKKLMQAKAALKRLEQATRPVSSGAASTSAS